MKRNEGLNYIANPVIKSVVNGENDNKTSKTKNGKKKYSDEDLDEKTIAVKIERLNKFWDWKVNKWKQRYGYKFQYIDN